MGETTHHLFALSRTLRIKLTFGFGISTVISISPLPAVLDYHSQLSDFHGISRAEGPTQLTWMPVTQELSESFDKPTFYERGTDVKISFFLSFTRVLLLLLDC